MLSNKCNKNVILSNKPVRFTDPVRIRKLPQDTPNPGKRAHGNALTVALPPTFLKTYNPKTANSSCSPIPYFDVASGRRGELFPDPPVFAP